MRILFIAHRTPFPPNKGDKLRSFWELRTLAQHHAVDLFCFYDDPEDEVHLDQLATHCRHYYAEKLSYFWSRVWALWALLRGRPFSAGFFYTRTMARHIHSALKSRRYDRIFVFSSSVAGYVETHSAVPKVLDLVDVDSAKWEQYAERSRGLLAGLWRLEAQRLGAYESFLVKQFSTTLVSTPGEAELLRSRAPGRSIRVVENYVDVEHYNPANIPVLSHIASWQPYIIFSGSMDYPPNVDAVKYFCREIFPLIRRERPEMNFVIAGRDPHPSVWALTSDAQVKVTGSVADMRPYLRAAAAAVAPMRIARGVQNKILEAMASGIPTVGTRIAVSGLPDGLRQWVRIADRPAEFAAAVTQLCEPRSANSSENLRTVLKHHMERRLSQSQLEEIIEKAGTQTSPAAALEDTGAQSSFPRIFSSAL